jgi:DNA-binding NarL/FixJ family response regulator
MKMENKNLVRVMVAGKPGIMRNSLLSYLRTIARVQIVALADDAESALHLIQQNRPQFAVIDSDLSEDRVMGLVQQINAEQPSTKIIVLVESVPQQQRCLQWGAQHALLKGFLDEQLYRAVLSEI